MRELSRIASSEVTEGTGVKIKNVQTVVTTAHEEYVIVPEFFVTGTKFKCKIQDEPVEGRLRIGHTSGMALLCQNGVSGYDSGQLAGYNYSWSLSVKNDGENGWSFKDDQVTELEFELDPDYKEVKAITYETKVGTYDAVLTGQLARVGCQSIPFERVKEVYEKMLELQVLEQEQEGETK